MNLRYLKLTFCLEVADSVEDLADFFATELPCRQPFQEQGVP